MSAHVVDSADDLIIDLRDSMDLVVLEPDLVSNLGLDIEVPTGAYHRWMKPAIDRAVAAALLLLLLPTILVIAGLLRVRLGRGVLFRQQRVGLGGRPFTVLKFRTMRVDTDQDVAGADLLGLLELVGILVVEVLRIGVGRPWRRRHRVLHQL